MFVAILCDILDILSFLCLIRCFMSHSLFGRFDIRVFRCFVFRCLVWRPTKTCYTQ